MPSISVMMQRPAAADAAPTNVTSSTVINNPDSGLITGQHLALLSTNDTDFVTYNYNYCLAMRLFVC